MLGKTALAASAALAMAQETRFLFTFGDSYSSTGFDPFLLTALPSAAAPLGNPAYPGTTTCNGPNWIDLVTTVLSPAGTLAYNFAYYGATVDALYAAPASPTIPTMDDQLLEFATIVGGGVARAYAPWTAANSAVIAWFGLNDIQRAPAASFAADLDDYVSNLEDLYEQGARRFLLVLLPPAQRTPLYAGSADETSIASAVAAWSAGVRQRGEAFAADHADANVGYYDPTDSFNEILDDPTAYGAPNAYCFNADGVSCLWWDDFHPGQAIHKQIAADVHAELTTLGFYD